MLQAKSLCRPVPLWAWQIDAPQDNCLLTSVQDVFWGERVGNGIDVLVEVMAEHLRPRRATFGAEDMGTGDRVKAHEQH